MKLKIMPVLIFSFLLFLWTGPVHGRLTTHSPEQMIEEAQFIVAGEVTEVRSAVEQPEFVVLVDTVYKGELGRASLAVPLPQQPGATQPGSFVEAPAVGTRMLFFFSVNEQRRLGPAGELNWAAVLSNGHVDRLYFGARYNVWEEKDYIEAYNSFLAVTEGIKIPAVEEGEESGAGSDGTRRPGELNPNFFFTFAGVSFLVLVIMALLKKRVNR